MPMVIYTKEIGKMIWQMVMVFTLKKMDKFTKESGKMISKRARVLNIMN